MSFLVAKSDGTTESFEPAKLLRSLERSGADPDTAKTILQEIEKEYSARANSARDAHTHQTLSTHEIYARAFAILRAHKRPLAARYSLKRAVLEFGPSGFPFEVYIAQLFIQDGYAAKIDQIIKGACVEHEVDIVLSKDNVTTYVEAKFHNTLAFKSDLKTALYVKARMEDLVAAGHPTARGLLVTNTKFTDKALEYAQCSLLELLSWDYPQGATLHERIARTKLYPVTALTSLSRREKTALLEAKIVLCSQLAAQTEALASMGITGHKAEVVLEEAGALCSS